MDDVGAALTVLLEEEVGVGELLEDGVAEVVGVGVVVGDGVPVPVKLPLMELEGVFDGVLPLLRLAEEDAVMVPTAVAEDVGEVLAVEVGDSVGLGVTLGVAGALAEDVLQAVPLGEEPAVRLDVGVPVELGLFFGVPVPVLLPELLALGVRVLLAVGVALTVLEVVEEEVSALLAEAAVDESTEKEEGGEPEARTEPVLLNDGSKDSVAPPKPLPPLFCEELPHGVAAALLLPSQERVPIMVLVPIKLTQVVPLPVNVPPPMRLNVAARVASTLPLERGLELRTATLLYDPSEEARPLRLTLRLGYGEAETEEERDRVRLAAGEVVMRALALYASAVMLTERLGSGVGETEVERSGEAVVEEEECGELEVLLQRVDVGVAEEL